jgi:cell division transport system permease protein
LISVSFLGFINVLTLEAVEIVKDKIDISVYFKPEVTPQKVQAILKKLQTMPEIQNIRYLSREDSAKLLLEKHKEDVVIKKSLTELGNNPLGDTLIIKATQLSYYPLILTALEQSQYKPLIQEKDFNDHQQFLNKINIVTKRIKEVVLLVSAVFAGIAVLIVFNTIRIAIYTHSEEIGIMKLVGAGNWFIRAPFLWEAVLYALFGTLLTGILLYPILKVIDPYVMSFFENSFSLVAYYVSHFFTLALWHFIGILILAVLASSLAVGRYLNV